MEHITGDDTGFVLIHLDKGKALFMGDDDEPFLWSENNGSRITHGQQSDSHRPMLTSLFDRQVSGYDPSLPRQEQARCQGRPQGRCRS